MLALLVIGRDPLGGYGLDVIDPQNIADRMRAGHGSTASMAALRFVRLVNAAAGIADKKAGRRELPAILGPHTGWQLCAMDAIGAALVIDQAARPEFGDRNEARALQMGGSAARSGADRRHIGIERQPRKL